MASRAPEANSQYLKEADAATHIGYATRTLANWRLRKVGPPFIRTPTGAIRYYIPDLDAWIRNELNRHAPEPVRKPRTRRVDGERK
jgi:hypothetical protein